MRGAFLSILLATTLAAWQRPARPAAPAAVAVAARNALLGAARPSTGILMLTPSQLDFNASDPDQQPVVAATTPLRAYVSVAAPRGKGAPWTLNVAAQGPQLSAGTSTIPVGAVTWNATGAVLAGNGSVAARGGNTPLTTSGVTVANGQQGTAAFQAMVVCSFDFHDSWNYAPGAYQQTLIFTLAAP